MKRTCNNVKNAATLLFCRSSHSSCSSIQLNCKITKNRILSTHFNNSPSTKFQLQCTSQRRGFLRGRTTCHESQSSIGGTTTSTKTKKINAPTQGGSSSTVGSSTAEAQERAYAHYRRSARFSSNSDFSHERNIKVASYAAAAVIGALGATYASVPLYKIFCQATGFGGTTQRVTLSDWAETQEKREASGKSKITQALWDKLTAMSNIPNELLPQRGQQSHGRGGPKTWTDEEAAARLASLRPVKNGRLITVRFDSTVDDIMPWSFLPTQLDVKVVPGETALSFFTATNHSDKAITGVATYNVHPPRAGLYFNKIQCFCFEEQRLLPGETVDMPVFFFVDPEYADDPQLTRVNNITLSYTFFQTDEDEEDEDEEDEAEEENLDNERKENFVGN